MRSVGLAPLFPRNEARTVLHPVPQLHAHPPCEVATSVLDVFAILDYADHTCKSGVRPVREGCGRLDDRLRREKGAGGGIGRQADSVYSMAAESRLVH